MKVEELDVIEEIGEIREILPRHAINRGVLIHALQKIQKDDGYLPEDVLRRLSRKLDLPLAEIYGVASFYRMFYFTPRGRKCVKVCLGTACYVRGAKKVLTALEDEFGIKSGGTTKDLALTLESVGCIGCCGLAPVATVDDIEVIGEIEARKLETLISSIKEG